MFQEHWLELDQGRRRLSAGVRQGTGSSPVLVLLHGVTRVWRDWESMVPFLNHQWTIYSIDHRGHGLSDRSESYLVADYANDLIELLKSRAFGDSVVLCGHSLGAMVAAIAAANAPERVRVAVLEDPPLDTMGPAIDGTTWQTLFRGMQSVCKQGGSIDQIAQALGSIELIQPDGKPIALRQLRTDEALRWSASCLSKLDPNVLDPVIAGRWLEGVDWRKVAAQIQCPTVLLQADFRAGGALSDSDAESFSKNCTRCEWARFPGQNHQLHGSIPAQIANIVNRFA